MTHSQGNTILSNHRFTSTSVGCHEYTFFSFQVENRSFLELVQFEFVLNRKLLFRKDIVEIR